MAKYEPVAVEAGSNHIDLIGSVVCLDVEMKGRRTLYTGVFHGSRDEISDSDELNTTVMFVGSQRVYLDWNADILSVRINKEK